MGSGSRFGPVPSSRRRRGLKPPQTQPVCLYRDTSGAEKLPGINSGGLANTQSRDQRSEVARLESGALDALINGGTGRSIEAALKGESPTWLMQLKVVL